MIPLGLVSVLMVGGFAWWALDTDDTNGPGAGGPGPELPDTQVLLTADDPQFGKGIFAFDMTTGNTSMVINDPRAALPTISADRQWIAYLTTEPGSPGPIPRLARADGSDDVPLFDGEHQPRLPVHHQTRLQP